MRYDVAVLGLGTMGAAAAAHLARRGARVAGLERFGRGHPFGAFGGESRIFRTAYFEHAAYVPMLQRASGLWRELERETGRRLLDATGVLMVGEPDREGISGTLHAARTHDLPLDVYDTVQLRDRFPQLALQPGEIGLLERGGGILFPEAGVAAHLDVAEAAGAELRFNARAGTPQRARAGWRIPLEGGDIAADRIVLACGMWTPEVLGAVRLPLCVQRNVQIWFAPRGSEFDTGRFPAFFVDRAGLTAPLYGFPAIGGELKAALHAYGTIIEPDGLDRAVSDGDVAAVAAALDRFAPGAAQTYVRGKVCTYTLTPDAHFILGNDSNAPGMTLACGFSGHGYKFAPVVGEIVASLALDGGSAFDIGFLRPSRFGSGVTAPEPSPEP